MSFHREYRDAFNAACDLARQLQREVGLEKADNALDGKGYRVITLPKPENRDMAHYREDFWRSGYQLVAKES